MLITIPHGVLGLWRQLSFLGGGGSSAEDGGMEMYILDHLHLVDV